MSGQFRTGAPGAGPGRICYFASEGILDDLDAVPWRTLRHATGAATAAPELIRALTSPDRSWIAFLLASIAGAGSALPIHGSGDEQRYRELFSQRGTTLEAELEQEARVLRSVHAELGRKALSLVPFLGDSQSEIRATVARALGRQTAHAAELVPELTTACQRETAPDAREAVRHSLEQLLAVSA